MAIDRSYLDTGLKVTYSGVEITYVERDNKWQFELRGRERSAESLNKAKEAIDKPEPKDKKAFTRIPAYLYDYSDKFVRVEVTSVADGASYRSTECWISKNGQREKKSANLLYAVTPENDAKVAEWRNLRKQIDDLDNQSRELVKTIKNIEVEQ